MLLAPRMTQKSIHTIMSNFRPGGNRTNIIAIIVTVVFLLIGVTFIVIATFNDLVSWFRTFGITLVAISAPVVAWLLYNLIKRHIEKM